MASAFGHAAAALGISNIFRLKTKLSLGIILLGISLSILPDIDVIGFKFGVPYESFWGHRGFTHSILFAVLISLPLSYLLAKSKRHFFAIFCFLFLATISHAVLDGLTTGGKGVAFFAPFDNGRYFLPWRIIQVSPIGMKNFISEWGLKVVKSEAIYLGLPLIVSYIIFKVYKKK